MIYLFLYLGILLNWLGIFDSAVKKLDFEWQYFARMNWAKLLFDVVIGFVLIFNKELIGDFVPIEVNQFSAFFIGYLVSEIGHKILKKVKAKI